MSRWSKYLYPVGSVPIKLEMPDEIHGSLSRILHTALDGLEKVIESDDYEFSRVAVFHRIQGSAKCTVDLSGALMVGVSKIEPSHMLIWASQADDIKNVMLALEDIQFGFWLNAVHMFKPGMFQSEHEPFREELEKIKKKLPGHPNENIEKYIRCLREVAEVYSRHNI